MSNSTKFTIAVCSLLVILFLLLPMVLWMKSKPKTVITNGTPTVITNTTSTPAQTGGQVSGGNDNSLLYFMLWSQLWSRPSGGTSNTTNNNTYRTTPAPSANTEVKTEVKSGDWGIKPIVTDVNDVVDTVTDWSSSNDSGSWGIDIDTDWGSSYDSGSWGGSDSGWSSYDSGSWGD